MISILPSTDTNTHPQLTMEVDDLPTTLPTGRCPRGSAAQVHRHREVWLCPDSEATSCARRRGRHDGLSRGFEVDSYSPSVAMSSPQTYWVPAWVPAWVPTGSVVSPPTSGTTSTRSARPMARTSAAAEEPTETGSRDAGRGAEVRGAEEHMPRPLDGMKQQTAPNSM